MKFLISIFSFLLFSPLIVFAQGTQFPNPLRVETIPELAGLLIKGFLGIAGVYALFFFIWGGFTWLTSAGNPEKIKKGKDTLLWAVFGLGAILLSYALVDVVLKIFGL